MIKALKNTNQMTSLSTDKYQERYLSHQKRKKNILNKIDDHIEVTPLLDSFDKIIDSRVSQRIFSDEKISKSELNYIKKAIVNTPSSCNRQGIQIEFKDRKKELEELLVGGKGWIDKADTIILLLADMNAYKSPAEQAYMPYLDAGFIGMTVYYACERLGLGCCYVNPNVLENDRKTMKYKKIVGNYRLCGAIAIGNYNNKAKKVKKSKDIIL